MNKRLLLAIFCLCGLLGWSQTALAVAHHERVEIKPVKQGGEVVGIQIKMTLRPESYSKVRVGISQAGKKYTGKKDFRAGASDVKEGHLLHQFKEVKVNPHKPNEVTFKLLYKDAPNLKPGSSIEVVSAFNSGGSSSYWHVYGMTSSLMSNPQKYTLPKVTATPKKPKPTATATPKKPKPKPTATPKKPKPTATATPKKPKPTAQSIRSSSRTATAQGRRTRSTSTAARPKKPASRTTRTRATRSPR